MQNTRLTSASFDKMIIESIDEVMAYNRESSELLFMFDQIKSGELTSNSEVVYAEGRQGVQLAAFDRNKTAGFTCENGYVLASAISTQLGTEVKVATNTDKITIQDQVYITATSVGFKIKDSSGDAANTVTLKSTPKATTLKYIYEIGSDSSIISKYPVLSEAPSGEGAATEYFVLATNVLTPSASMKAASGATRTYVAIYDTEVSVGKKVVNTGDKFAGNVKLVINFVAQDPCSGNKYLMQAIMPNAKVSGSFSLSAGNDPAVQNFEASAMLDICSVDKELFTITMA